MITLSLGQAAGYKLEKPDGGYKYITRADPYEKMLCWDGLVILYYVDGARWKSDPCCGFMSWEEMKRDYQVEIVLTPEEEEMVERGRLSGQVMVKAKELTEAIDKWLMNEKAR